MRRPALPAVRFGLLAATLLIAFAILLSACSSSNDRLPYDQTDVAQWPSDVCSAYIEDLDYGVASIPVGDAGHLLGLDASSASERLLEERRRVLVPIFLRELDDSRNAARVFSARCPDGSAASDRLLERIEDVEALVADYDPDGVTQRPLSNITDPTCQDAAALAPHELHVYELLADVGRAQIRVAALDRDRETVNDLWRSDVLPHLTRSDDVANGVAHLCSNDDSDAIQDLINDVARYRQEAQRDHDNLLRYADRPE